jgi:TrmH family RNA methyltransferase
MNRLALSRTDERTIHALRTRKQRTQQGLFLAEGVRVSEDAIDAGLVLRLAVVSSSLEDNDRGAALLRRLEEVTQVHTVSEGVMRHLASTETPQGVLLVAEMPVVSPAALVVPTAAVILVLDAVQDPGNFGTLVRTADAFAAAAVIALPGTVDPWNPKSVRAAAGSSFRVPLVQMTTTAAADWLRQHGFTVLAADAAGTPIAEVTLPPRVALVVGNEGAGVRADTVAAADSRVAVPMRGRADSLNVAVAAGILLDRITTRLRS